ncbi:MAG: transporter [Oscillospiraceae bacterium]|nr:transporter [Oscillospiraceae bacterium]
MKDVIAAFLKRLTAVLEFVIAMILAVGIILLSIRLIASMVNIPDLETWPNYDDLLETCFNLIIGVELIRMMYYHTSNTVFEVLLFAIARQIIVDHTSTWTSLIGVCTIAVLFATRKFLFCEFGDKDETVFRAGMKVKAANRLLGVNIPHQEGDTLLDTLERECNRRELPIAVGTSIDLDDCQMRILRAGNGKVTRVEIIRSLSSQDVHSS